MNTDKALANFGNSLELLRGGDTGKGRVEHRSFEILRFTLNRNNRLYMTIGS